MEKINRLSLPTTIIIASVVIGGFYFASQLSKQKSIERQQQVEIEQKRQEQSAQELKEQQAKEEAGQALNTCLSNASSNYNENWYNECKGRGLASNKCIDMHELTFDEYLKKYNLTEAEYKLQRNITSGSVFAAGFDYYGRWSQDECSCRLPSTTATRLDGLLKDDKDACYKLYPQN
jgi:hypothetical protein